LEEFYEIKEQEKKLGERGQRTESEFRGEFA
jgi:hypothetical protein